MEISYIILAHKNPQQLRRLVNKLATERSFFYIHIDKNAAVEPFLSALAEAKNVFFLNEREAGTWGDVGIVKATIHALTKIVLDKRRGYSVLMSGQDYPIKSNAAIHSFFKKNNGINFIESFALPNNKWDNDGRERIEWYKYNLTQNRSNYILFPSVLSTEFYKELKGNCTNILRLIKRGIWPTAILRRRKFPDYLKPYGGAQWWAITTDSANEVVQFLSQHSDYVAYHKYSLLPDEFFFQSILQRLALTGDVKIKATITYTNWDKPGVPHPVTFTKEDFDELKNLPEQLLFARKFDVSVDETILDLVDTIA
ncbi:MAG: beta-1,6-N-acetylglucosaminyltransferase [Bacteroidota bacterium]